ncbi:DDB1- and CUL4-associated factor 6 isoform X1 [Copidosoma floridanum]|uniref:DDB1- and CUL4-associated factor 6 isoform X1 n=1 Tax=Copidosoma floridanum TaxID=29053 RepID=UPI0006C9CEDE|nr:DDB1- and CUL4-associated factor 6 isoform X1 [Copidosoma floridanum]XP_014207823.1 DDB1- and CUL4-associated factor 6 isoform X1 [Copidosoma floridanum]XP_014207824.1 DDB1- and CUL4-associated factor 6 isoform X1 [Copidosoma floridanum]XP_014207825.1 DDB1- and CUL4-associated factor 6 isoform X1 [Copidosoma floridanum]XP_014207826.1 DDB1- and CUL4-associated factor 6 isoform X1 [Copidosoma floridanum]XP_014207828.1 DDB1- and CUL4-associated factor 6 isoform X1 [Copidosoma floridanum]XP_01
MHRNKSSVFHDIHNQPYNMNTRIKLHHSTKSSLELIQRMAPMKRLEVHKGCVNSICWNNIGDTILSGSDDQHLVLTNTYSYQVTSDYKTSHRANIFSAKFLPDGGDHRIVSCSGDGTILYTDLMKKTETYHSQFNCHSGTTYEIATVAFEPNNFLSCGEDGTVRWFDLRIKEKCNVPRCREDVLISLSKAITAVSVNPILSHQVTIGCSDSIVRTFDRRMLRTQATGWTDHGTSAKSLCSFTVPEFEGNSYRITSLSYSPDGQDVLVSYSSEQLYLFGTKERRSNQLTKKIITENKKKPYPIRSSQPVRRLRLRGDWSDTGPDARPEREGGRNSRTEISQARPVLHTSLMQRMTDVLTRMLNDPATRAALSGGGEDSFEGVMDSQVESMQQTHENVNEVVEERNSSVNEEEQQSEINRSTNNVIEVNTSALVSTSNLEIGNNEAVDGEPVNLTAVASVQCESQLLTSINYSHKTRSHNSHVSNQPCNVRYSTLQSEVFSKSNATKVEPSTIEKKGMMENLQDRLTTIRDSFLERHGSEPTVKLTYSDKSSTSTTILLGVAEEVKRDSCKEVPSMHSSSSLSEPGPSSSHKLSVYDTTQEVTNEDVYNDSDDENTITARRGINAIETEMDEATKNACSIQVPQSFEESCSSGLTVKQKYMGHRNASFFRTMIKEASFWGDDFVMSGSDCGHVFVWERNSARLCMLLEADQHVVNCVQPHPFLPLLATSGIDYDVKIWAPINETTHFDETFAEDLKKRNAVMLEETKDTITVPAVFMIRMLACLNQIRRGRLRSRRRSGNDE